MKTITTTIAYAYPYSFTLLPNVEIVGTRDIDVEIPDPENEGEFITTVQQESFAGFKSRLTIVYDLKDDAGVFVKQESVEHYSELVDTMATRSEYEAWDAENRDAFVAADKLELAGYTGE